MLSTSALAHNASALATSLTAAAAFSSAFVFSVVMTIPRTVDWSSRPCSSTSPPISPRSRSAVCVASRCRSLDAWMTAPTPLPVAMNSRSAAAMASCAASAFSAAAICGPYLAVTTPMASRSSRPAFVTVPSANASRSAVLVRSSDNSSIAFCAAVAALADASTSSFAASTSDER